MSAEQLITDNLDIWTSAIKTKSAAGRGSSNKLELYGIKKLRELILELAVRGLLVPQNPNEEPASVLLEKIANEKAKLVKEGKIKKQKVILPISKNEKPFKLPLGWAWVRLAELSNANTGFAFKSSEYSVAGTFVLRVTNINPDGTINTLDSKFIPPGIAEDKYANFELKSDDVLLVMVGGSLGKIGVVSSEVLPAVLNQNMWKLDKFGGMPTKFFIAGLKFINENQITITKSTHGHLAQGAYMEKLFPLPPVLEQNRIVAKVDELMALCDQLGQQQESSLHAHQTLVDTLLDCLVNAKGTIVEAGKPSEFHEAWTRISDNFDTLFTTESSIDKLKQTILQLAVMGKLVPQDPNDEPASVLLKKIAEEKERLVKEGKIKKQKPLPPISEEETPYDLPENWEWCYLTDIGELARGKSKHRPRNDPSLYEGGSIPLVQTGDVSRANGVIKTYTALYNEKGLDQSKLWPKGTMCITIAANIADTSMLGFDACFPDSVVGYTPFDKKINAKYFEYFIRTAKEHLEEYAPSTAQKNINLEILSKLLVPCPPVNEFQRIVIKVNKLFELCESLKKRIKRAQLIQLNLANAYSEQTFD